MDITFYCQFAQNCQTFVYGLNWIKFVNNEMIITPRENPRRRSVGPEAPQAGASDFRVGVQKKSAKILTMEAKTVKTNKRTKSGQKSLKSDVSCDYFVPL